MSVRDPDPSGMAGRILGAPRQIAEGLAALSRESWRPPAAAPRVLAVGAMGGSAMAADLVRGLEELRLPRPMLVVRDARWPAFVDADTCTLLCSYSGHTAETLALYGEAGARGAARLALSSGGELAARSARDGVPCLAVPGGSPPRAALYAAWVRIAHLPHALGWIPDPAPAWREAEAVLDALNRRLGPDAPQALNGARRLARALAGRFVLVYARSRGLAPVALRWRQQLEENAKCLAHDAVIPELNHNGIVGWERTRGIHARLAVVVLRDGDETPDEATRLDLTAEFVTERGAALHEVRAEGAGAVARAASLTLWADWTSYWLALEEGADPTAIPSIDEFKRRLAQGGAARD